MAHESATPRRPLRTGRLAFTALVMGALCISLAPIFVRLSELPPSATAFYRMLLALPLFWLMMGLQPAGDRQTLKTLTHKERTWLIMCGLLFAADLSIWHWSIYFTTVANATLLGNFAPIFVTAVAWFFFRERISWKFVAGMIVAFTGASLLMGSSLPFGPDRLFGDFLGIVTAVFYAGYLITIKQLRFSMNTIRLMGYSTLITCVALLFITIASGEALLPETLRGWLVLLGLAVISQVGGQGLITYAMAHLPVSFSSVSLLIQPVAAALLGWVVLDEVLTLWQAYGGLAVLIGIAVARKASLGSR